LDTIQVKPPFGRAKPIRLPDFGFRAEPHAARIGTACRQQLRTGQAPRCAVAVFKAATSQGCSPTRTRSSTRSKGRQPQFFRDSVSRARVKHIRLTLKVAPVETRCPTSMGHRAPAPPARRTSFSKRSAISGADLFGPRSGDARRIDKAACANRMRASRAGPAHRSRKRAVSGHRACVLVGALTAPSRQQLRLRRSAVSTPK